MENNWALGPWIGVARVGNSPSEFYLEPDAIGVLPIECNGQGSALYDDADGVKRTYRRVRTFKDALGRVKRQAARFRIFCQDGKTGKWRAPREREISSVRWTVHLANKKACWYHFSDLDGDREFGGDNDYGGRHVARRNPGQRDRRALVIDPGPRSISFPSDPVAFDAAAASGYVHARFPGNVKHGDKIETLGEIRVNQEGELLVLGGYGHAGTSESSGYVDSTGWHDDISDGPVTCSFVVGERTIHLEAWCIVGPPKFVPEVVSIVSLADVMEDVAVRHLNGRIDDAPNYQRDIRPILQRPAAYRWVAAVPAMNSVSPPPFDPTSNKAESLELRRAYLSLFRKPGAARNDLMPPPSGPAAIGNFPMMPLNSGSNPLTNEPSRVDKFMTLTETQYLLLTQWAGGQLSMKAPDEDPPLRLTRASVGNCVGAPLCPGIEVSWSVRSPNIYLAPFRIRHRHDEQYYRVHGLNPNLDETGDCDGCEPGDLTKRMAVPWQAEYFECQGQPINFTDARTNETDGIPVPPTYYAPWWPPQSPLLVVAGDLTRNGQALDGVPAGYQVPFFRGINTHDDMISSWHHLGFVVNQATGSFASQFPHIAEQERNLDRFQAMSRSIDPHGTLPTDPGDSSDIWFLRSSISDGHSDPGDKSA